MGFREDFFIPAATKKVPETGKLNKVFKKVRL